MFSARAALCLAGAISLTAACASFRSSRPEEPEDPSEGVTLEKGAVILTGPALSNDQSTVLTAMVGKVPNFRVRRHTGECPEITLRTSGNLRARERVYPHVYVDGTRSTDTCILDSLRTNDVERVDVYPQGFTTRPGYGTHNYGLILVFMRSAQE
jgi:hypothetical protein